MADILFQCVQQGTLGVIYTARWYLGEEEEDKEGGRQTSLSLLVWGYIATDTIYNFVTEK